MRLYYDLHIHSCLSPCGDGDMTPNNIVNMARLAELDIIALTDHNTCGNCAAILQAAVGSGVTVLPGMELCTAEEAHVVCLFPALKAALAFAQRVRSSLPPIANRPDIFGEQLLMDAGDNVVGREDVLLTTASAIPVDDVPALVRSLGGAAFPAHIDRPSYSVTAALGDIPPVGFCAAEITAAGNVEQMKTLYPSIANMPLLLDSDAHYLHQISEAGPWLDLPDRSPEAVIAALDGRTPCAWGRI